MIKTLISLGLIATTFVFTKGDIRVVKMDIAMLFAVAIGLSVFYYGRIIRLRNKWLLFFMMYLPFSYIASPKPEIKLFGMNVGAFWSWQPLCLMFVFFMMIMAIASYRFNYKDVHTILLTFCWCGFLSACYVVLQYFNIDQFFYQTHGGLDGRMAGFVGNPTLVSPFIAMVIPVALYFSDYLKVGVMGTAVVMTDSQMAIIAMVLSLIVYYSLKGKRWVALGVLVSIVIGASLFICNADLTACFIEIITFFLMYLFNYIQDGAMGNVSIMAMIILSIIVFFGFKGKRLFFLSMLVLFVISTALFVGHQKGIVNDSSRFEHWPVIVQDITQPIEKDGPTFPVTGIGVGSFKYVYHIKHNNNYHQAHNEYLELMHGLGIAGISLFLMAIFSFLKPFIRIGKISNYQRALVSSFVCIALAAFGTFVWQIGTTIFATAVVAGLLINQEDVCVRSH